MREKGAEPVRVSSSDEGQAESTTPSLGSFLAGARESRGMSRAELVRDARIPDYYVRMIESNDYSMISDQLYVLPFLRRYASFLELDPEAIAMRFVREVQRADNTPSTRGLEPIEMDRHARRNWTGRALVTALVAVIVGAWLMQTHHRRAAGVGSAASAAVDEKTAAH
ncbi:MAG: helix-turn-helix domain-containing protein [Candidatus Binataceae bacterium]